MPISEYDCSKSQAIARLAFDKEKRTLTVQFRTQSKIYLYSNISFGLEQVILRDSGSLGRILAFVKRWNNCREETFFPANTEFVPFIVKKRIFSRVIPNHLGRESRPRRSVEDYSADWLQVLSIAHEYPINFLAKLVAVLAGSHPLHPPSYRPPIYDPSQDADRDETGSVSDLSVSSGESSHASNSSNGSSNRSRGSSRGTSVLTTSTASTNPFSSLGEDDEDEHVGKLDLDYDDLADELEGTHIDSKVNAKASAIPATVDPNGRQSRYLLVRLICSVAEAFHLHAIQAQKDKAYNFVTRHWEDAFAVINDLLIDINGWSSIFESLVETSKFSNLDVNAYALPNYHNFDQLQQIIEGLRLVAETITREKKKALLILFKRKQFIEQKLNPMLDARNFARQRMGNDAWTNNPAPKMTYAEKRKGWESELRVIDSAVRVMEKLELLRL